MEENNQSSLKDTFDAAGDALSKSFEAQLEASQTLATLISRSECVNIIVDILNAFLSERQKSKNPLPENEILAIQSAVNLINQNTQKVFESFKSKTNEQLDTNADKKAESEKLEQDN